MASCNGSGTHGPGLQLGPRNFDDALIFDSIGDKSFSHSLATKVDSKYCQTIKKIKFQDEIKKKFFRIYVSKDFSPV